MKSEVDNLEKIETYRADCLSLCKTILALPSILIPTWLYLVVCRLFVFLARETEDMKTSLDATNICLQNPNNLDVVSQQEFRIHQFKILFLMRNFEGSLNSIK